MDEEVSDIIRLPLDSQSTRNVGNIERPYYIRNAILVGADIHLWFGSSFSLGNSSHFVIFSSLDEARENYESDNCLFHSGDIIGIINDNGDYEGCYTVYDYGYGADVEFERDNSWNPKISFYGFSPQDEEIPHKQQIPVSILTIDLYSACRGSYSDVKVSCAYNIDVRINGELIRPTPFYYGFGGTYGQTGWNEWSWHNFRDPTHYKCVIKQTHENQILDIDCIFQNRLNNESTSAYYTGGITPLPSWQVVWPSDLDNYTPIPGIVHGYIGDNENDTLFKWYDEACGIPVQNIDLDNEYQIFGWWYGEDIWENGPTNDREKDYFSGNIIPPSVKGSNNSGILYVIPDIQLKEDYTIVKYNNNLQGDSQEIKQETISKTDGILANIVFNNIKTA